MPLHPPGLQGLKLPRHIDRPRRGWTEVEAVQLMAGLKATLPSGCAKLGRVGPSWTLMPMPMDPNKVTESQIPRAGMYVVAGCPKGAT